MDTALVIGADGGVGIRISRQLVDHRYQISGLARSGCSAAVHGGQAVFFAAGVGFNAPVATPEAVDRDAAIRVPGRGGPRRAPRHPHLRLRPGERRPEGYKTGWWKHCYTAKHAASCQGFFPLRPRQQPQQVRPPVPPHPRVRAAPRDLHEHLGERLRPRGMPVPAAIRTSSTTPEHAPTLDDGGPQST